MDSSADARVGPQGPAHPKDVKLKVRTHPRIAALKGDVDCQISPHSPLVSTELDENGWVCGNNGHGQLGIGSGVREVHEPQPLKLARRWACLAMGSAHSAAVTGQGEVYTWGLNDAAQLGIPSGPGPSVDTPRVMELLGGWNVRGIACGSAHTVAFTMQDVITWGANDRGQCGHGERAEMDWVKPRSIKMLHDLMITQVVCGAAHTLCVTGTSQVFSWGANSHGQLGLGDTQDRRTPAPLDRLWALPVQQLAAGDAHSAALTSNGFLFTWGANDRGQLGLPAGAQVAALADAARSDAERHRVHRRVNQRFLSAMLEMGIPRDRAELALHETGNVGVEVAAEWLFSMPDDVLDAHLLTTEGNEEDAEEERRNSTTARGNRNRTTAALLMHELERDSATPKRVALTGVRGVACGAAHTIAYTADECYAWGAADAGQLGLGAGAPASIHAPQAIPALSGLTLAGVAAGGAHSLFVPADGGAVLGCGDASTGALPLAEEADDAGGVMVLTSTSDAGAAVSSTSPAQQTVSSSAYYHHQICVTSRFAPGVTIGSAVPAEPMVHFDESFASNSSSRELHARVFHHQLPLHSTNGVAGADVIVADHSPLLLTPRQHVRTPRALRLPFLRSHQSTGLASGTVVSVALAGPRASAFLTRARDEPTPRAPSRLWERLAAAVGAAREAPSHELELRVKPIAIAVERIFGSPAAICAAFGAREQVGLDVALLESVASDLVSLEREFADAAQQAGRSGIGAAASLLGTSSSIHTNGNNIRRTTTAVETTTRSGAFAGIMASSLLGGTSSSSSIAQQAVTISGWLFGGLHRAFEGLLSELERNVRLLGTPERAQVLLAACQLPLLADTRCAGALVPRLCAVVLSAPPAARHLLVRWWSAYPGDLLERRVVAPLQRYLTDELYTTKKLTVSVMNVIKVLARVEEASAAGRVLPPEAFYNELISEKLDVLDHYVAWRQTHDSPAHAPGADGPFSFCSYPFLLNPRAKSKLLHTEARIQMDQTVAACRAEAAATDGSMRDEAAEELVVPRKRRRQRRSSSAYPMLMGGGSSLPQNTTNGFVLPNQGYYASSSRAAASSPLSGRGHPAAHDQNTTPRRRERGPGGLRWLFNSLRTSGDSGTPRHSARGATTSINSPTAAEVTRNNSLPVPMDIDSDGAASDDERRTIARQASDGGGAVWRQGSLNLPSPEESGFPATHPDMCILRIRRNHLLEDALDEVARQKPKDLFKPLRVHFIGEDGIDAGGVKKEFFQLLVAEVLSPDYGMLTYQPESRTYWFCPVTMEEDPSFLLLGLILGLAIYNGVLLDFPLPLALYRKILGQEVRLRDLEDMQPSLGRGLRSLLQYEPALDEQGNAVPGSGIEDVFCQSFAVEVPGWGERRLMELKPGGADIPVTEDSRREFVDLYVDYWLNSSVHTQFEAFARGFLMLCGGPALQLFSATELERLVCGNPCLDFEGLQRSARYEAGYSAEHRVVQWLWEVVGELSDEEKRLFLKFFTGSDRSPIGGLANLRCVIQRDGADSNKLPTSHTCFNTLLLPSYKSRDKLADRLRLAILNSEGFGLE